MTKTPNDRLVKAALAASKNLQAILKELPNAIHQNKARFSPEEIKKINDFSKEVDLTKISQELADRRSQLNETLKKYT